jgi:hypothetical protein
VGEFTGSAGPALTRAAARLAAPGAPGSAVLTGAAEYRFDGSPGRETVIIREDGEERTYWEEDPLTGETWLVTARVPSPVPRDIGFKRARGTLTVDWALRDGSGEALRSGRDVFSVSRAVGGYVDRVASADSPAPPDDERLRAEILDELAEMAAADLTLLAGPRFTEGDLAPVPDQEGRRARALAVSGDWEGAADIWRGLLSLNPAYDPALYNLGLYNEIRGDIPEAWRHFRLAFQRRQLPLYRAALTRASRLLRRTGSLPRPE